MHALSLEANWCPSSKSDLSEKTKNNLGEGKRDNEKIMRKEKVSRGTVVRVPTC